MKTLNLRTGFITIGDFQNEFDVITSSNQRLGVRSLPVIIVVCNWNHYCERLKFYRHNVLTKSTVRCSVDFDMTFDDTLRDGSSFGIKLANSMLLKRLIFTFTSNV